MATLQFLTHSDCHSSSVEVTSTRNTIIQPVTLDSFHHSASLTEDYHCSACNRCLTLRHGWPPEVHPHPQHPSQFLLHPLLRESASICSQIDENKAGRVGQDCDNLSWFKFTCADEYVNLNVMCRCCFLHLPANWNPMHVLVLTCMCQLRQLDVSSVEKKLYPQKTFWKRSVAIGRTLEWSRGITQV